MRLSSRPIGRRPGPERAVARWWRNVSRGRAQKTLAAATAASALPLGVEIYFEHFRGSFGDKWMWTPVALSPALSVAAVAGMRSEHTPATAAALSAGDSATGVHIHLSPNDPRKCSK